MAWSVLFGRVRMPTGAAAIETAAVFVAIDFAVAQFSGRMIHGLQ
jgi:hypothetical protein